MSYPSNSLCWKIILQDRDILTESLRWCIGNGKQINFWNDPWVENLPLRSVLTVQARIDHTLLVKDVIDKNGPSWNLSLCANDLPSSVQEKIQSIVVPVSPFVQDSLVWQPSKFGDVTAKEAYKWLLSNKKNLNSFCKDWKSIWHLRCPQKIRSFMWLVAHNRIPVHEILYRVGIGTSPKCPLCHNHFETELDHFFQCPVVQPIWTTLACRWNYRFQLEPITPSWLIQLCSTKLSFNGLQRVTLVPFILWHIWLARNELVFNSTPFRSLFVLGKAYRAAEEYQFSMPYHECSSAKQQMLISWKPPAAPYIKLNSDGAASSLTGAGIGGVL